MDIYATNGTYNLKGDDAVLDNATIIDGQMVITGETVRKLSQSKYEIDQGSYTNCNIDLVKGPDAVNCSYAWKVYGRFFSLTMGEYAYIHDAIVYIENLPVYYIPYFVAPVKTERQSGLLMLEATYRRAFGNGFTLPYFWAIGPWHDATFTPTFYTELGYHLGLEYRYKYDADTFGEADFFVMQRKFSPSRENPAPDFSAGKSLFGLWGEWATHLKNQVDLGNGAHHRFKLHAVSHPYYTFDYFKDIGVGSSDPSLRSFASLTVPSDHLLFTGKIEHHQSLLISRDDGVDRGSVTQLPSLSFSQMSLPLLDQFFAFEFDSDFHNFFRPTKGFDSIPSGFSRSQTTSGLVLTHVPDTPDQYQNGDYIRTGRRLQLEPRLIANIPMPSGFQFQPILKGGTLLYHFDFPSSEFAHQEYAEMEVPLSLYFSKTFETENPNFQKINHVFQPRVVYATSLYQRKSDHAFFFEDGTRELSNPRFDSRDLLTPFEYMRFELINRFRRKSEDTVDRFLLLQLSEQYNLRTSDRDPRFKQRIGPIELLAEFRYGYFSADIQALYQLETVKKPITNEDIHEYDWSSTFSYQASKRDYIRLTNRFKVRAEDNETDKLAYLYAAKSLPIFFDLDGRLEYSLKDGDLRSYQIGFLFGSKPLSCWKLQINLGRDALKQYFANFTFELGFGTPGSIL